MYRAHRVWGKNPKTLDWDIPLPKANGSYICGRVQGVGAAIILDTDATHTFISDRFFHQIPKFERPILHGPGTLKQAGYWEGHCLTCS